AMTAKIPVILLLTRGFGMGVEALPLSHAVTVSGESVFLMLGLRGRVRGRGLGGAHVRIVVASAALGLVAWGLRDRVNVVLVCAGPPTPVRWCGPSPAAARRPLRPPRRPLPRPLHPSPPGPRRSAGRSPSPTSPTRITAPPLSSTRPPPAGPMSPTCAAARTA